MRRRKIKLNPIELKALQDFGMATIERNGFFLNIRFVDSLFGKILDIKILNIDCEDLETQLEEFQER